MTALRAQPRPSLATSQWLTLGTIVAVAAAAAVLAAQAVAIALWPDVALFKPLDSYARAALFTVIPAFAATGLFAWLARRRAAPDGRFLRIAGAVLLVSFIPDYLLPVPDRTILASSVAAFLHVVAAGVIVAVLIPGYRRFSR